MVLCLVIRGKSYSGKTFASNKLEKTLNVKCIHYDTIINFICECTRLYFEDRINELPPIEIKKQLNQDLDIGKLRDEIKNLIENNLNFFQVLYDEFIKNTISFSYLKQHNMKINDNISKLINLGKAGTYLEKFSDNIFDLIIKYVLQKNGFFILEGSYFHRNLFLNSVEKNCNKIWILNCSCIPALGLESYSYNQEKFSSLKDVEKRIITDFEKYRG